MEDRQREKKDEEKYTGRVRKNNLINTEGGRGREERKKDNNNKVKNKINNC